MPISKAAFVRSTAAGMLIGVLTLFAVIVATLWLAGEAKTYNQDIAVSRQLRSATIDLLTTVTTAESGQRGFLLTADQSYLAPFRTADAQFPDRLVRFREVMAGDQQRAADVARLAANLTQKMGELEQTVSLAEAGNRSRALEIVQSDQGRALMDGARRTFSSLLTSLDKRIADNTEQQQANVRSLQWVTVAGAVLIFLIVGAAAWMTIAYTGQLVRAERQVNVLNTELELRVKTRTADLARANEEIQRFAYIVTHDLRAPLVNVMGFTSELESGLTAMQKFVAAETPEEREAVAEDARLAAREDLPEAIGFIRSSTRKMDGLINAILKLSREGRRTLRPERVSLPKLLEAAVDNVRHQVMEAEGEVAIDAPDLAIYADRLGLEQIFGNLLDNAVKYRAADRPLRLRVTARPELGGMINVDIEDNGRGIAAQDHDRVFDLFRRSGAQDQAGEGIGLAHVRAMARNLGGDITLQSELGRGATFTLRLPRDGRK